MGCSGGKIMAGVSANVALTFPPQGADLPTTADDLTYRRIFSGSQSLTFGTASGQFDTPAVKSVVLGAGASVTYDLYTGSDILQLDGSAAPFRTVKYVGVFILSGGDASGISVGGAASNAWGAFFADASDIAKHFPSGVPFQQSSPAGVSVGSSTKNFNIANNGAVDVTLGVVVAGNLLLGGMWTGFWGFLTYS